jgi:hypothetical protein
MGNKKNAHPMLGRTLLSVVPPSLGDLTKLKNPLVLQRDLRPASLITQVQQIDAIPFTLITAVCPFEANCCRSLQKLRGPFNIDVWSASHQVLLSVSPDQCVLFLISVFCIQLATNYKVCQPFVKGHFRKYFVE